MAVDPALLRNALARTVRPIAPARAEAEFGGGAAGRSALAQAIAGTTDKKSKAYKAAMRNLQRYAAAEGKQRRTMGDKLRPLITKAAQTRRAANRLTGPIRVRWKAPTIRVSADSRQRLDFEADLDEEALAEVRELLEQGDDAGAMDAFAAASLEAYWGEGGTPWRGDAVITDAAGLTILRE